MKVGKVFIVILSLLLSSCVSADDEKKCLTFSEGRGKNHVEDMLVSIKRNKENDESSKYFSSSYDLNGDGNNELFYFFETYWSCGSSMGCNLTVYEYIDGQFVELIEGGLYPRNAFNPRGDGHKNYICISKDKDSGWSRLEINDQFEMRYVDKFYKAILN